MPQSTNTQSTIDKAIRHFHDCLEVEFPHLKGATYLDCDDVAALSKLKFLPSKVALSQ